MCQTIIIEMSCLWAIDFCVVSLQRNCLFELKLVFIYTDFKVVTFDLAASCHKSCIKCQSHIKCSINFYGRLFVLFVKNNDENKQLLTLQLVGGTHTAFGWCVSTQRGIAFKHMCSVFIRSPLKNVCNMQIGLHYFLASTQPNDPTEWIKKSQANFYCLHWHKHTHTCERGSISPIHKHLYTQLIKRKMMDGVKRKMQPYYEFGPKLLTT